MSLWLELHCDMPLDKQGVDECARPSCHSSKGNSPGMMVRLASELPLAARMMSSRAIAKGWIKTADGWRCPACKAQQGE